VPSTILHNYPGTREYLPELFSRWHYRSEATNWCWITKRGGDESVIEKFNPF
jgi:hypothetical protein